MAVTVDQLLQTPFSNRDLTTQCSIILGGRPRPELPGITCSKQTKGNLTYEQSFDLAKYDRFSWLTGCPLRSKLFCWPCLLFGNDSTWARSGFAKLNTLLSAAETHWMSKAHIKASIELKNFEHRNLQAILEPNLSDDAIEKHNLIVERNRVVLSYYSTTLGLLSSLGSTMINQRRSFDPILLLLGKDYFSFPTHKIPALDSHMKYFVEEEPKLESHLKNSNSPLNDLYKVQADFGKVQADMYREHIKIELTCVPFVAIDLDYATNVDGSKLDYLLPIMRYALWGSVFERVLTFVKIEEIQLSFKVTSELIEKLLTEYDISDKLVSVCIAKLTLTREVDSKFREFILQRCPNVIFADCYQFPPIASLFHNFRQTFGLDQSNSELVNFKEIMNLCGYIQNDYLNFWLYIKNYTEYSSLLSGTYEDQKDPTWIRDPTDFARLNNYFWLYFVFVDLACKKGPARGNKKIQFTGEYGGTCCEYDVNKILKSMFKLEMALMVTIFGKWAKEVEDLHDKILKLNQPNLNVAVKLVKHLKNKIEKHNRDDAFELIWSLAKHLHEKVMKTEPNRKLNLCKLDQKKDQYRKLYEKSVDVILLVLERAYSDLAKLNYHKLLITPKLAKTFQKKFPEELLSSLRESPHQFDCDRLKAELSKVYNANFYGKDSVIKLYQFLVENNLDQNFPETTKLACLILTIGSLAGFEQKELITGVPRVNDVMDGMAHGAWQVDDWVFTHLNNPLTKQLRPRYVDKSEDTLPMHENMDGVIGFVSVNQEFYISKRPGFRDEFNEEWCQRFCQLRQLDNYLYKTNKNFNTTK